MNFFSRKRQRPKLSSSNPWKPEALPTRWASLAAAVLAAGVGCAEVTQEEPESRLAEPGAGGNPTGSAGNIGASGAGRGGAGQGATGSVPVPGTGGSVQGEAAAGGAAGVGTAGSSASGSGAQGGSGLGSGGLGSGGDTSQGGTTPDPGPQFPAGTELFREDFESDDVSRWTLAGGTWTRTLDAESNSNVFSQGDDSSSATLLAVSGDASWRDVRVEADFKVLAFNGSSSSYMAGICVRLSDAESFYMVGLRGDSNQHIGIRRFGSSDTNLNQSEEFSGVENEWYRLRVDAIGDTLSVFIDDDLVVEQTDAEHPAGGIGLCTARATAVFDNIVVTAP